MATKSAKQVSKSKSSASSDDFIPEGAVSANNSYMKFDKPKTKFRIISNPIFGWIEWIEDGDGKKPIRTSLDDEPEASDAENKPKKFMTVVVIDREDGKVKILEITQQSVIKGIKAYSANPEWGKPFGYDINVEKKGEGMKTRYTVTSSPAKPLDKATIKEALETPCNLEALLENENPWEVEDGEGTEYQFK